jgi:hypothetical protein
MLRVTTKGDATYLIDEAAGTWERVGATPERGDLYGARVALGEPLILLVPGEHPPLHVNVLAADPVASIDGA